MSEEILSLTLETLRDLLLEEAKFLYGVSNQVREIQGQLQTMKSFLRDADQRQHADESIRIWVQRVRGLAYRTEDILEMYGVEVSSKKGRGLKNVLKRFSCIFNECFALHRVGVEIAAIESEITKLKTDRETFGIRDLHEEESSRENQRLRRQTYAHQVEQHFVGMKDDIRELLSLITDSEREHRVVSIWGIGGLGKSTLARRIYNHEVAKRSFERFAWVCITQQCEINNVLQDILEQLGKDMDGAETTTTAMVRGLYNILEEKKCLLVIDDIWKMEDWEILCPAFPITSTSSQVLLTTRIREVATKGHCYELNYLTEVEGWELLQKKAFIKREGTEMKIEPEFEHIGKEIVRKCGNLPLAISVLGGILREKSYVREWEMVLKDMDLYLEGRRGNLQGASQSVPKVLGLSYDELPYYLKPCFLYMGCYEEDESIEVVDLYHQWIAEGLVLSEHHRGREESMMDVAERYLDELASRCMVEMEMHDVLVDPVLKGCRLHDLMRDLCLAKGKEEEFWKVIDMDNQDSRAMDLSSLSRDCGRRLHMTFKEDSSMPTEETLEKVFEKVKGQPFRSLSVVRNIFSFDGLLRVDLRRVKNFKLVRVVRLGGCDLESSGVVSKLIYLRYLSFRLSKVKELPSSISILSYLQTLDLRVHWDSDIYLPNIFWKMKRLKHIYLPFRYSQPLEFKDMSELETLCCFRCALDTPGHLSRLTNLRYFEGQIEANAFTDQMVDEIRSWKKIKWLQLEMIRSDNSDPGSIPLRKLLSCQNLNALEIRDIPLGKLPLYEIEFWPNLVQLTLENTKTEEDPMQFLKSLPYLRRLILARDAFLGKEMFCDMTAFPQLKYLRIDSLPNLEKWKVDDGAMPNLSYLVIDGCVKLETITDGLNLPALENFDVSGMPQEFRSKYAMLHKQERNKQVE